MYSITQVLIKSSLIFICAAVLLSACNDQEEESEMIEMEVREKGLSTCPENLEPYCPASEPCEIFKVVEAMPRFFSAECENLPNADDDTKEDCAKIEMLAYLDSTIVYPAFARENQIEGVGVVQFIVRDTLGCLEDIRVSREDDYGFGEELVRVVASMPPFVIGRQRGRKVRVLYTLSYEFELD